MVLRPLRSATASYPTEFSACETMSTSVYNPFSFSELRNLRAMGRRPQVDATALARARRDLFGPIDHEDTRKFVMRELAAQQIQSADRWGFDFEREQPLPGKYFWEKVTQDDHVPQAYAHHEYSITTIVEDADVSAAAPTPPASPLEAAASTCPSSSSPEVETAKPTISVRKPPLPIKRTSNLKSSMKRRRKDELPQMKMTDFLRIRKSTSTVDGAKIRRLSDPIAPTNQNRAS